jgi:hypothetical protein
MNTDTSSRDVDGCSINLAGTILNYRCTRAEASFVLTQSDETRMGLIAIAAGLAGMSGSAATMSWNASHAEEEADFVEFDLNGMPVKGRMWRSPFNEGDAVEVAAKWQGDHYEVSGIARPDDRTIALFPHCSRGRIMHYRNAFKAWIAISLLGTVLTLLLNAAILKSEDYVEFFLAIGGYGILTGSAIFGVIILRMTRRWMRFVYKAEETFATFGWPNTQRIDLVKSSKVQRKPDDPFEFGYLYFRY